MRFESRRQNQLQWLVGRGQKSHSVTSEMTESDHSVLHTCHNAWGLQLEHLIIQFEATVTRYWLNSEGGKKNLVSAKDRRWIPGFFCPNFFKSAKLLLPLVMWLNELTVESVPHTFHSVASFDRNDTSIWSFEMSISGLPNDTTLANPSLANFLAALCSLKAKILFFFFFFKDAAWYRRINAEIIAVVAAGPRMLARQHLGFRSPPCREVRREFAQAHIFTPTRSIHRCQHKIRRQAAKRLGCVSKCSREEVETSGWHEWFFF